MRRFSFASLFSFFSFLLFSQAINPVKWEFSYHDADEKNGEIILKAIISDGWHIYSQLQAGDGPQPTVFHFEPTPDYDKTGDVSEPDAVRQYSDVFNVDVLMFSNEVIFTQKIKRSHKKAFIVLGTVECMCCNNSQCLPPKTYKFRIEIPAVQ